MAGGKKSLDFNVSMSLPATAVWKALGNASVSRTLLALVPEIYSSIEGGPFDQPGATLFVQYANGLPNYKLTLEMVNHSDFAERFTAVDEGASSHNYTISIKLIHGANSDCCVVQFSIEYAATGEEKFFETVKEAYVRTAEIFESRANAKLNYN